ncbi:MAG: glycerol-3-phosphate 1-O-acyltransferase PlsY [Chthoniobacteraceae bacterium]
MLALAFSLIGSYLLGSIPFGLLAARLKGMDIRQHGSGNIGATNVWRVCGWRYGLPVFVLDVIKGVAAVWLSHWLAAKFSGDVAWAGIVGAMACIIGHSFPVWLGFKGGKGVATSLGVFLGLMPLPSLVALLLWAAVFKMSGYVSLASIVAAVALPGVAIGLQFTGRGYGWPVSGFAALVGLLVIMRHRSNITRLRDGTENRFTRRKS